MKRLEFSSTGHLPLSKRKEDSLGTSGRTRNGCASYWLVLEGALRARGPSPAMGSLYPLSTRSDTSPAGELSADSP